MWLMVDPELGISDVLAGMKYLSEIQFPVFPERGLGRDRIAELYSARKVCIPPPSSCATIRAGKKSCADCI